MGSFISISPRAHPACAAVCFFSSNQPPGRARQPGLLQKGDLHVATPLGVASGRTGAPPPRPPPLGRRGGTPRSSRSDPSWPLREYSPVRQPVELACRPLGEERLRPRSLG